MNWLALAAAALAVLTAAAAFALFGFLALTTRSALVRTYLRYSACNLWQGAVLVAGIVSWAAAGPGKAPGLAALFRYLDLLGTAGVVYAGPAFFAAFAGKPLSRRESRAFSAAAVACFALLPLCFAPPESLALPFVPGMVTLLAFTAGLAWGQARLVAAYPGIEERLFRVGVPSIVVYNIVVFAVMTVDSIAGSSQSAAGAYPTGFLMRPLLTVLWSVASFAWAIRFHSTLGPAVARPFEPSPAALARFGLSEREGELVGLLAQGLSNKEIAAALGISPNTARNHLSNIFRKAEARSRLELVRKLEA